MACKLGDMLITPTTIYDHSIVKLKDLVDVEVTIEFSESNLSLETEVLDHGGVITQKETMANKNDFVSTTLTEVF